MNKQEIKKAIEALWRMKQPKGWDIKCSNGEWMNDVYDTAISALEQQLTNGWIPVTERLPNKDGYYLVSCKGGNVIIDFFWDNNRDSELKNTWENKYYYEILAWRERPKHYTDLEEVFDRR